MKIPGPEHPITIDPSARRVRVVFGGETIADSTEALTLHEASLAPVLYIPRSDVDMARLERTSRSTHCPYKGDAAYYTIRAGGRLAESAVWTYEHPYEAVASIAGRLAFYRDRVDILEA